MSERPILLERWSVLGWRHRLRVTPEGDLVCDYWLDRRHGWVEVAAHSLANDWYANQWLPDFCADTRLPSLTQE